MLVGTDAIKLHACSEALMPVYVCLGALMSSDYMRVQGTDATGLHVCSGALMPYYTRVRG